jgi:DNA polymerase IV
VTRCIFHVDMDAFFASIEIIKNPALKGKPVIVGGRPDSRGVVSTCSYEARTFGVRSAMPTSEAHRLCPHGIFLEGDYSSYRDYSHQIVELFYQITPYVEVVSVDEAYLDVTTLVSDTSPQELAVSLKRRVFNETQLTCSIGIAANKLVAKIASSKSKPNGLLEVISGAEASFLAPLPIQSIPGVGTKTQYHFNREGIKTVEDLQAFSKDKLVDVYGAWGYYYYHLVRGEDNRPVHWENSPPKSIGAETTFEVDQTDLSSVAETLKLLFQKAYKRLRAHKMRSKRVSLKLKFYDFKTISRSVTLFTHSHDANVLQTAVLDLLQANYSGAPPLRLVGVSFEQLTDAYWQPTFWDIPDRLLPSNR